MAGQDDMRPGEVGVVIPTAGADAVVRVTRPDLTGADEVGYG